MTEVCKKSIRIIFFVVALSTSRTFSAKFQVLRQFLFNIENAFLTKLYENFEWKKTENKNISVSLSSLVRSVWTKLIHTFSKKNIHFKHWHGTMSMHFVFRTMLKTELKVTDTEKYKGKWERDFCITYNLTHRTHNKLVNIENITTLGKFLLSRVKITETNWKRTWLQNKIQRYYKCTHWIEEGQSVSKNKITNYKTIIGSNLFTFC